MPTEATVAHVLVCKYADHLPLYRQAQIMSRQGVDLDRSTLADWVGRAAFELRPVFDALKRMRRERGITQEDFATDSGFDRGYISGVERGVRNPSATVLARIAQALEVDVIELVDAAKANAFAKKQN